MPYKVLNKECAIISMVYSRQASKDIPTGLSLYETTYVFEYQD